MPAPRPVILDIEDKGLSHSVAHKHVAKDGKLVSTNVSSVVVKEPTIVTQVAESVAAVVEDVPPPFIVEPVVEEPVVVEAQLKQEEPQLAVNEEAPKKVFKKQKKLSDA